MFTTTLTLEERIARAQAQLTKAKENRRKAYGKAAKTEKKAERRTPTLLTSFLTISIGYRLFPVI